MNKRDKSNFKWGAIFGLIAPCLGLFAGLQVLPVIGTILLFPAVIISKVVGLPFGEFSTGLIILSFILSVVAWGVIFLFFGRLKK